MQATALVPVKSVCNTKLCPVPARHVSAVQLYCLWVYREVVWPGSFFSHVGVQKGHSVSKGCAVLAGDGKCVICDSYVRPCTLVRICDECNYGSYQGRCVICGGPGVSDAYYCKECTIQEKDVSCLPSYTAVMLTFKGLGAAEISAGMIGSCLRYLKPLFPCW